MGPTSISGQFRLLQLTIANDVNIPFVLEQRRKELQDTHHIQ